MQARQRNGHAGHMHAMLNAHTCDARMRSARAHSLSSQPSLLSCDACRSWSLKGAKRGRGCRGSVPVGGLDVLGHVLRKHARGGGGGGGRAGGARAWTVAQLRRCGCTAPRRFPPCTPGASSHRTYPCASSKHHKHWRHYTARRICGASRSLWCSCGSSGCDSPPVNHQTHRRAAVRLRAQ